MLLSPEATTPIIGAALKFLSNLNEIEESDAISGPVPRLPQEILFSTGGWLEGSPGSPTALIETFDIRADRWMELNQFNEPFGPRSYHGAAVIGNKIYCIGGCSTSEYCNKCSVFDVVTKTWTEVNFLQSTCH